MNHLIQVRKQGAAQQKVLEVINELVAYSTYHFEAEDEFMLKNDYPLFISHRKFHMTYHCCPVKVLKNWSNYMI